MVSDYNRYYNHGPEVEISSRRTRKSDRKKKKIIIILIIAAILILSIFIFTVALFPSNNHEEENLSWFYEMQEQNKNQNVVNTESRVYDLSNPNADMTPKLALIDSYTVKLLYDNNISFSVDPSYQYPYYLKLSDSEPVIKIAVEYFIPDVSYSRSVIESYITKKADDGVYITIGEKYKEILSVYPDPDAHFGIIVTDESGYEVFTDGYNYYGSDSSVKQVWSLYAGGNYNIELVGSKILANVKIYEQ